MSDTSSGAESDFLSSVLAATAAEGHGVLLPDRAPPSPHAGSPEARAMAEIERRMNRMLDQIVNDARFVALEARWRALHRLASAQEPGGATIALASATKRELVRDLQSAAALDATMVWRGLVDDGLDPAAPRPVAALLLDHEWGPEAEDIDSLHLLGGIGGAAHCAILAHAAPSLLGLETWDLLPPAGELTRRMQAPSHARWRSFRDSEESRFVALAMPPLRLRAAGPLPRRQDCMVGAGWLLAEAVVAGFADTGLGLPAPDWRASALASAPGADAAGPLALRVADPKALAEIGLIAALPAGPNDATIPQRPTAQRPKRFDRDAATRHAMARAHLGHLLAINRFAQALTVLGSRARRAGASPEAVRGALAAWLAPHCQGPDAPLAEARVDVQPARGGSGPALLAWLAPRLAGETTAAEPVVLDIL